MSKKNDRRQDSVEMRKKSLKEEMLRGRDREGDGAVRQG